MNELLIIVGVSLKASISATFISALLGIPVSVLLAHHSFRGRDAVLTVLNSLLAVPTVVIGLFVYSLLSRNSPLGELGLLYTMPAIIIGQVLLALPIMIILSHSAMVSLDPAVRETAFTLGARGFRLVTIIVREARFGIMAAIAATFGRLIGEIGISMMLGGNIHGYTRTITTAIALETSKGEFAMGLKLGAILLVIALGVNILFRTLQVKEAS